MPKAKHSFLDEPEIFRPGDAAAASRAQRRGELRRLARGLYTTNLDEPAEQLVRRRWMDVAALYFPGAVIVDRSAVEGRPASDGSLFLDSGPRRSNPGSVLLPGLLLKPRSGPGPLEGDMAFGDLYRSGEGRTALANMRPSRARDGVARTLTAAELEKWLERIARNRGEGDLLKIRDEARTLAPLLDARSDQQRLDELIAALLGTGDAKLVTDSGQARGCREPFDAARIALFETLHGVLAGHISPLRPEPADPNRIFAFFEAYSRTSSRGPSSSLRRPRKSSSRASFPRGGQKTRTTSSAPSESSPTPRCALASPATPTTSRSCCG
jgi:hypothetical protein